STSNEERVVYLSANENFYLGQPKIDSFAVHVYSTKEEILSAINSGRVTATAELSATEANGVSNANFYQQDAGINSGVFAFFNLKKSVLSKNSLRKAIQEGIDISAIREAAPGTIALDFPLLENQIILSNYPALPAQDFEVAKAKIAEIIGENGLTLNIATVDSEYLPAVAEKLAEQLRALGIEASISTYAENQEFVANVIAKRDYDILVYEIELGTKPDPLAYYHSSQTGETGLNLSNYRNTLVDDLLVGARETLNEGLRAKKYERFLEYFVQDVPAIGLYQANLTYIYNKNTRTFGNQIKLAAKLDRFSNITDWAAAKGTRNLTP
ncbi:MAG: ABC transporter substrate-binding protein, partial [Candidatus Saccharibacteria bacterium]|nr:ABC transporter substrate-binding protein [Candidatus Saccharibacteria bacterium]